MEPANDTRGLMASQLDISGKRIFVAGHKGLVGQALVRRLEQEPVEILTAGRSGVDLRDQAATKSYLKTTAPDIVIVAAAKVGGILANATYPVDFLNDNLLIESNLIAGSHEADIDRLLFLGSSCIYPREAPQPMREDALLTGPLEPTNKWYAIAKIAGIMLCQAYREQYGRSYISAMPTNLYGPGDNFDLNNSHVIPALMRKVDAAAREGASSVEIWGTGTPLREFMHVDDLADALVFLLREYDDAEHINVGTGEEVTIAELAQRMMEAVGFSGELRFDKSKPDGTPRKVMDCSRLAALGWRPKYDLAAGLKQTYEWYTGELGKGEIRLGAA
ncbi:GDP-L-fucose synthetase [Methyloceanibacter caenitepidi]|uniref:GDP-L-fucose synthase n=2 Tax=Methyloceanibacter caenitepidi TaxID=1384459 RepID=A0A0A8K161_9HYPH|nr:GDP-L-fucose synthetase [Methyloceanibacter caenitepidi]